MIEYAVDTLEAALYMGTISTFLVSGWIRVTVYMSSLSYYTIEFI